MMRIMSEDRKATTVRLNPHQRRRVEAVMREEGGISMQAALAVLIARGLRAWEDERVPVLNQRAGRYSSSVEAPE